MADSVIAWIGLPDRWSKRLFDVLNRVRVGDLDLICRSNNSGREHNPECLENIHGIIAAAGEHLRRPWFRRTWVRQEVFGSGNLKLYCGGQTISLPDFLTATRLISDFELRLLCNSLQPVPSPPLAWLQVNETEGQGSLVPASVSVLAN